MSKNLKLSLALVGLAVAVLVGASALTKDDEPAKVTTTAARSKALVRADSPRLTTGTDATFVEFLDFECESCGQLYPIIEDLKDKYGDRVAFVVRYMPLHTSSINAARAAEAAKAQDRFEDMYDVLFQRQAQWGHKDKPEQDLFFTYAEELGLDMEQFRAVYEDPATLKRIKQSETDGRALGVTGTPTMFLDGERLEPKSIQDITDAFDAAVGS